MFKHIIKGMEVLMLITLFIGNGFDLNNGLQTTFTDFYDHIMIIADELSQWWEVR